MDEDFVDNVVCQILFRDGPDQHIDGHEVITEFINALLAGEGEAWWEKYKGEGRRNP